MADVLKSSVKMIYDPPKLQPEYNHEQILRMSEQFSQFVDKYNKMVVTLNKALASTTSTT